MPRSPPVQRRRGARRRQGREARPYRGQPCQQAVEHRQRDRRAIEQTLLQRRRPPQARREPGLQGIPLRLHRVARRLRACAGFAQLRHAGRDV